MLAPLPRLHRLVVLLIVLASGLCAGLVMARTLPLPFGGLFVGVAAGSLVGFLLLHDFHPGVGPGMQAAGGTRRR